MIRRGLRDRSRGHEGSTWFSQTACSGEHSPTWDHHIGRATHRHSAEPNLPITHTKMLNMGVSKPTPKWSPSCLSHPVIQVFPTEAQALESKDRHSGCVSSKLLTQRIHDLNKMVIVHDTKFKAVCYIDTVVDDQKGMFGPKTKPKILKNRQYHWV